MRGDCLDFVWKGTVRGIGFGSSAGVRRMLAILVRKVGNVDGLPTISRIKSVSAAQ